MSLVSSLEPSPIGSLQGCPSRAILCNVHVTDNTFSLFTFSLNTCEYFEPAADSWESHHEVPRCLQLRTLFAHPTIHSHMLIALFRAGKPTTKAGEALQGWDNTVMTGEPAADLHGRKWIWVGSFGPGSCFSSWVQHHRQHVGTLTQGITLQGDPPRPAGQHAY